MRLASKIFLTSAMVVVVLALFTVCDTPVDVLTVKLVSPAYVAVTVFAPDVAEVSEHVPAEAAAVHVDVPSLTVTLPVRDPAPGAVTATL